MQRPLLIGLILSIAIHGAALYSKGGYTPAEPRFETGLTVVQLTLIPSRAAQAAALETEVPVQEESLPEPVIAKDMSPVPETVTLPMSPPSQQPPSEHTPAPVAEEHSTASQEQDATLLEEKGVMTDAVSIGSIQPVYPGHSRRRGEEGDVILSIEVLASGETGKVELLQSSNHKRLDRAAIKAAREAVFTPASESGRPVNSTIEKTFTFKLTDD